MQYISVMVLIFFFILPNIELIILITQITQIARHATLSNQA